MIHHALRALVQREIIAFPYRDGTVHFHRIVGFDGHVIFACMADLGRRKRRIGRAAGLRRTESIDLDIRRMAQTVEVMVRYPEHVGFAPTLPPEPKEASRWGLFLVDRVSDRWSVVEVEDGRMLAWCEIDIARHEAA